MSSINPQSHNMIQAVDNQIQEFIQQAKDGQQLDSKGMASLVQQMSSLLQSPEIPDSVKQGLQNATNELKQMSSGQGSINNLFSAKTQIDALLNMNEGQSIEPSSGHGVGGGSLGGGGGGSEE